MTTVKIHVHPAPAHSDYDYCVPFRGMAYDGESYCDRVSKLVADDTCIVLTSNGEPDQRLSKAKDLLDLQFQNVSVESRISCYASQDTIFEKNLYKIMPKIPENFDSLVDYYLTHYQDMSFVESGSAVTFRGFRKNNQQFWYHYGRYMPWSSCNSYVQLNCMLETIFQNLVRTLSTQLDNIWTQTDIEDNLLIRINHNEPNSKTNSTDEFFQLPHLDTSIVSVWLWSSGPGAVIYPDQQGTESIPVLNLFDQQHEYCMIPGLDYCDFSQTMTPATWHAVCNEMSSDQHRVSIVAFLRHPQYNR